MRNTELTFGEMLTLYRRRKKLTIAEVAKEVGVSGVTISNYEHNRSIPNSVVFQKLTIVLDASMNDLMCKLKEQEDSAHILRFD